MTLNATVLKNNLERAKKENGGVQNLGMSFYKRLFEKYPSVKPLFKTPPEEQHKKLIASVATIVNSVDDTERLVPYLRAMAIRHLKYGTENGHYDAVAENLVAVLSNHLSVDGKFSEEDKQAWQDALKLVNEIMIDAASNPEKYEDELKQHGFRADGFRDSGPDPWLMEE